MSRITTKYNEIIGVLKSGEIIVLDETFRHGTFFHGATGYSMEKLTQQEIDNRSDDDDLTKDYWKKAVEDDYTQLGFEDWLEVAGEDLNNQGLYFFGDDDSFRLDTEKAYNKLTDEQRKQLDEVFGVKGEDFVDYQCVSCGQCVETDREKYKLILNEDLLKLAQDAQWIKDRLREMTILAQKILDERNS